jgi:hypothetical protein
MDLLKSVGAAGTSAVITVTGMYVNKLLATPFISRVLGLTLPRILAPKPPH